MAESDTILVYITTVSSTLKLKKNQIKLLDLLDSKKIPYKTIDIAANEEDKIAMREKCGNEKAIPPQVFRGDTYLGDYEAFENAVEAESIMEFLGVTL